MPFEASRKLDESQELGPGSCPRCGVKLRRSFKYCPNCAYRLRPEIVQSTPLPPRTTPVGDRLVALGGYLAFASMLLLVVYAGFRLFAPPETGPSMEPQIIPTRDANCLRLTRSSFRPVEAGRTYWGIYAESDILETPPLVPEAFHVDDRFQLSRYEITNDQYYGFLLDRARNRKLELWLMPQGWTRSGPREVGRIYDRGTGDEPVTHVAYPAALEFCAWFWEERLGADESVVVDLPSWLEFVRAGRGDSLEKRYPWDDPEEGIEVPLDQATANLRRGAPLPVNDPDVGEYGGFHGLVGNVAEWVYWDEEETPVVAGGWSFEDARVYEERLSPFSVDGFRVAPIHEGRPDIGFRIVLRTAPVLPEFVRVGPGKVTHGSGPDDLLPPDINLEAPGPDDPPLPIEDPDEEIELPREPPVTFAEQTRTVARAFEITRTEITNRQYLYFLVSVAPSKLSEGELGELVPQTWNVANWVTERAHYRGHVAVFKKLPRIYTPGFENQPVQGLTVAQARAYCAWLSQLVQKRCRIPTVGEYLRAGREANVQPYPWGANALHPDLVCNDRADSYGRAVSVRGRGGDGLFGLVGNVAEFVVDDLSDDRLLLAGGFFEVPARLCTLDCFMDAQWTYVEYVIRADEAAGTEETKSKPRRLAYYTGFRVVKVLELF